MALYTEEWGYFVDSRSYNSYIEREDVEGVVGICRMSFLKSGDVGEPWRVSVYSLLV